MGFLSIFSVAERVMGWWDNIKKGMKARHETKTDKYIDTINERYVNDLMLRVKRKRAKRRNSS